MNNFWTLVGFEYKKILHKKTVLIAFTLAMILILFSCFSMVLGGNTQGNYYSESMSAYDAMLLDKSYEKQLEGRELDGELIVEASKAYQKINTIAGRYTDTEEYQKYARPYSSVYTLIDAAYAHAGSAFNVEDFQNITEEDAYNYYAIRENQYRTNLTNNPLFSASDIEVIMAMDKEVQKPFIMSYKDGYQRFFSLSITIMAALLFVLSFAISPIFSDEYSKRTDSLILASKNGKKSLIMAKVFTSLSLTFIATLVFLLSAYFICMAIYGFEGTNAQIQLLMPAITYNFTLLDCTLLLIITSLFGAFLHTALCMFISSLSRNAITPMALTSLLIMAGMINIQFNPIITKLRYLLPCAMGSFFDIMTQFVFNILGMPIMLYQMACITAFILGILFILLAFQSFRKHQI